LLLTIRKAAGKQNNYKYFDLLFHFTLPG
jgi:hypothetical protein